MAFITHFITAAPVLGGLDPQNPARPPRTLGFIAREVVGLVRLAGDIAEQTLELFCKNDLSFDRAKEAKKRESVSMLLKLKHDIDSEYAPLKKALNELAKKAQDATGRSFVFLP